MFESSNNYGDGGAFGLVFWLIVLGVYFYFAFAQYKIAQKVGLSSQAWWGFIPILNVFLFVKCAGKDWYWVLFLLIPVFNIIAGVMLWLDIAKRLGKNAIWAILTLVPFLNFIAIGVMAFGAGPSPHSFPPQDHTPSRQPTRVG